MHGKLYAAARASLEMSVAQLSAASQVKQSAIRNIEADVGAGSAKSLLAFFAERGIVVDTDANSVAFPLSDGAEHFGKLIAVARAVCGYSQQALSGLSGVSLRTISAIEKGTGAPLTANADAITATFERQGLKFSGDAASGKRMVISVDRVSDHTADEADEAVALQTEEGRDAQPDMMRLHIELDELKPKVSRELLIPKNATFSDLHAAIQIAFGWSNKFSHEFRCGMTIGPIVEQKIHARNNVDERLARLDQIDARTEAFVYRYGKGAHWLATITLNGRATRDTRGAYPVLTDGKGACPPEDAWAHEWNEMAKDLRKGKASPDTLNWLHFVGFGRDYNPDTLDIEAINRDFAGAGFDIPATCNADKRRQEAIAKNSNAVLPTSYPTRPTKPQAPVGDFRIVKSGPMAYDDLVFDPKHGLMTNYPKKGGGDARWRSTNERLSDLLEISPDVASFETFPLAIHWQSSDGEGVFNPDVKITMVSGDEFLLHIAHDEQEFEFARAIAAKLSISSKHPTRLVTLPRAFLDDAMVKNSAAIIREVRWMKDGETDGIAEALISAKSGLPIPLLLAVHNLSMAGFGREVDGFTGGNPEQRTLRRLVLAVAEGLIGMDFSRPIDQTIVGLPELTAQTLGLGLILKRHGAV
jgi:transcriptional regulator with XRE-family HTH domain